MSSTLPPSTMPPIDTRYARIIAIALPVLLANLAMPLQSVIDTAIVGNMNDTAKLAGMGLAIQLLSLILVSFNFLQYASSGLSAQALGQLANKDALNNNNAPLNASNRTPSPLLSILQRALLLAFMIGAVLLIAKPWLIDFGLHHALILTLTLILSVLLQITPAVDKSRMVSGLAVSASCKVIAAGKRESKSVPSTA